MNWKPSPNFNSREGHKVEAVVLHIGEGTLGKQEPTLGAINSHFKNESSQVSAHYGIGYNGEIDQYVKEENSAWHAGIVDRPTWKLLKPKKNPNHYTIGIEHEGYFRDEWPETQKKASVDLIRDICLRWKIPIDREHIIGHYEIKASKPNCPAKDKRIIDELVERAKPVELKIEELKKVQINLLRRILSVLQEKLSLLLNRKT